MNANQAIIANRIGSNWEKLKNQMLSNPSLKQQYFADANMDAVSETIQAVQNWAEKLEEPLGFAPIFKLAEASSAYSIAQADQSLAQAASGAWNQIPLFLTHLNGVIASVSNAIAFSGFENQNKIISHLSTELAQAIEVYKTAKNEVANKIEILAKSEQTQAKIEETEKTIADSMDEVAELAHQIRARATEIEQSHASVKQAEKTIQAKIEALESAEAQSNRIMVSLGDAKLILDDLCQKHNDQVDLVAGLLPTAATIGLARAYSKKARSMTITKITWQALFASSLLAITVISGFLYSGSTGTHVSLLEFSIEFAKKIPMIAPLIWLAWFSAIQFGNIMRTQEDYEFKEASATAFVGFKDHISTLHSSDPHKLDKLYEQTLRILSENPLRMMQKPHQDANPGSETLRAGMEKASETVARALGVRS